MSIRAIDSIYWEASQIEGRAARQAFLDRSCAGDYDLREQIEHLLAVRADAENFLEKPPGELAANIPAELAETPGNWIGRYKLLQQIGEGGMGTVWMAEQLQPIHRQVAIKIIKPGNDSGHIIARFEAERQALALMNHPNIARVLDAGTIGANDEGGTVKDAGGRPSDSSFILHPSSFGRPYFVMELVKGVPITRYCDEKRLTPRQRVELFVPVCEAIRHAHRKGIIHRDIKPSNVLVCPFDGKPVPKVIDFGVAKAIGPRLTDRKLFTEFGQIIGTLEYMSPEQAELNNADVDTRSDIYSLGVLLFELLTGSTPFGIGRTALIEQAPLLDMLRAIREVDPPTPSNHLSTTSELPVVAGNRGLEPARLPSQVRGELDWIVMRCLEKDRNRRYETANDLAADLQRYLTDEQVAACPPSAGYRLKKFVRRNRVTVFAAAVVLISLLAGVMGTSIGLVRAMRLDRQSQIAAEQARDAADSEHQARLAEVTQRKQADEVANLIESLFRDLEPVTQPEELKFRLVERLNVLAADLENDYRGDPLMRARLRLTLSNLYFKLGNVLDGVALEEKALAERTAILGRTHPDTLAAMRSLATAYETATTRGHPALRAKALALFQEVYDKTVIAEGADSEASLQARTDLAFELGRTGDGRRAIQLQEEVWQRRRELNGQDHSDTIQAFRNLGIMHGFAGDKAKQILMQEEAYTQARSKLGDDDKRTLFLLSDLAAHHFVQRNYNRAIELYQLHRQLLAAKNGDDDIATLAATTLLADAYRASRQFDKAIPLYVPALDGLRKRYPLAADSIDRALIGLAGAYSGVGKSEQSIPIWQEYYDRQRTRRGPNHPFTIEAMFTLGRTHIRAGQYDMAIQVLEELVAKRAAEPLAHTLPQALTELALAYRDADRLDDAADRFRAAATAYEKLLGSDNISFANCQGGLGAVLVKQQKYQEAEPILRQSHSTWKKKEPDTWYHCYMESLLGAALAGQKRFGEAESFVVNGYEGLKKRESLLPEQYKGRVVEALERVVQLYDAWEKKDKADEWRKKLAAAKVPSPDDDD
jgi:serine/threonine protein kinase/tetratricopeptide (TPR) repeat protein